MAAWGWRPRAAPRRRPPRAAGSGARAAPSGTAVWRCARGFRRAGALVGRIALWPSTVSRGTDWSGLTVPSADVGPAYATNGCGYEAHGAVVPARLAGAFHGYLITWSPHGFSVAVDGRTLYRDGTSFDGPRWLGVSLAATGRAATTAQLLVEEVVAFRWTGPLAPAGGTALDAVSSTPDVLRRREPQRPLADRRRGHGCQRPRRSGSGGAGRPTTPAPRAMRGALLRAG